MSVYTPHKTIIVDVIHKDFYTDSYSFIISSFHQDKDNSICILQSEIGEDRILNLVDKCSDQMLFSSNAISGIYDACNKILSPISDKPLCQNKAYNQDLSKFLDTYSISQAYTIDSIIPLPDDILNTRNKFGNKDYINYLYNHLNSSEDKDNKTKNKICLINMRNLINLSGLLKNKLVMTKVIDNNFNKSFDTCEKDLYGSILGLIFLSPCCDKISTSYYDNGEFMINLAKYVIHNKNHDINNCIINRALNSINYFDYGVSQHKNLSISIIAAYAILNKYGILEEINEMYSKIHNSPNILSDQYFIELTNVISKTIWLSLTLYNNSDYINTCIAANNLDINNLLLSAQNSISKYKDIILNKNDSNALKQEIMNILSHKIKYHLRQLYSGQMFTKSSNLPAEVSLALLLTNCSNQQFSLFLKHLIYNLTIYNPNYRLEKIKMNFLKSMFLKYVNNDPICMTYTRIIEIHNTKTKTEDNVEKICQNESINNSIMPYILNREKIVFNNFIVISVSRFLLKILSLTIKSLLKLYILVYKYLILFIYTFHSSFSMKLNVEKPAV